MDQLTETSSSTSPAQPTEVFWRRLLVLSVASLGVVYGDIGTSPLYAVHECFHGSHAIPADPRNVLGVVSLIVWALLLIISIKYLVFILRADNRGEGGILALAALLTSVKASPGRRWEVILILGLFGAALLYADGIITPAISVLSAVEGLSVAAPHVFDPYVVPITITILVALFFLQSRGTTGVGTIFGPTLLLWFLAMGLNGLWNVLHRPAVFLALSPHMAFNFLWHNGWLAFPTLGSVFLAVTGGEALYADMGHFGARPIRLTWFSVVLPALLCNYLGQGAFLLREPTGTQHPFFRMAPDWALYPLVGLATVAAVIASQAVITGAFSLTLQAIQLGYAPRLTIRHTSSEQIGQIYIPVINWLLMLACISLVLGFGSSSNLAAAYGVAITMTMVITTILFYTLVRTRWKWPLLAAIAASGFFLIVDLSFFGANILKIADGGWFPLFVAGAVFLVMSTWRRGREILAKRLRHRLIPLELFLADLLVNPPIRVPGTAIFMFGNPVGTPPALRHNVVHNKVLHETVVILGVETAESPHVAAADRISIEEIGEGFWRVNVRYGFMEEPDIPRSLAKVRHPRLNLDGDDASYFLGRETLLSTAKPGMMRWREHLFVWLSRNAQTATNFFNLPPQRVVEVGVQVEL